MTADGSPPPATGSGAPGDPSATPGVLTPGTSLPPEEVDLTEEDRQRGATADILNRVALQRTRVEEKPFDLLRAQEETRGLLAKGLFLLLAATVLSVIGLAAAGRLSAVEMAAILSPVVTLTGTALGFYFARH